LVLSGQAERTEKKNKNYTKLKLNNKAMKTLKPILIVIFIVISNFAFSVKHENSDSAYKSGNTDFSHEAYVAIDGDIYKYDVSDKDSEPIKLNINTRYDETCPVLSSDSNTLYFVSNRKGGYGGNDIWASERLSNGNWCEPYNLGKQINTSKDEDSLKIMEDGVTLLFTSNGRNNNEIIEYYTSTMNDDGLWSQPE
jgi:hypothetical protein